MRLATLDERMENLAEEYATSPLGFSGRTSFDEKEAADFKAGFKAALELDEVKDLVETLALMADGEGDNPKTYMQMSESAFNRWKQFIGDKK